MAEINLFLKGTREPKTIYYRYRPSRQIDLNGATPFKIHSQHWDKEKQCWNEAEIVKGAKLAEVKKKNLEITNFNDELKKFKINLSKHISDNLSLKSESIKESINDYVNHNYFGHKIKEEKKKNTIPENFVKLIDHYICIRSTPDPTQGLDALAENTKESFITLKNKISEYNKNLKVTEINNNFRTMFIQWLNNKMQYSASIQSKFIKQIKLLCKFAESEYEIKKDVAHWKIINNPPLVIEKISFTKEQVEVLEKLDLTDNERLDNARDWLIISCYSALRISDLFKLDVDNIVCQEDLYFYPFTETKTKKQHSIWLFPSIIEILKKRKWQFPKIISSQKYNNYIKEVCKIAGFTEETEGAKRIKISIGKTEKTRMVKGVYPFYELVTSHIGRRTFATMFSNEFELHLLRKQTGHSDDKMLENYITTSIKEKTTKESIALAKAFQESGILNK